MFTTTTETAYVLAHLFSAAVAAGVGLWATRQVDVRGSNAFAALMAVDTAWVLASAVEVLASSPDVVVAAATARGVLSLTAVVVWFRFASIYTGRSTLREDPWSLVVAAVYLTLVGGVFLFPPAYTVAADAPFVHAVARVNALTVAVIAFSAAGIFGGIARLGSLFLRSRHRSPAAVFALLLTAGAATLPSVAAEAGLAPVPAFDHTALGVGFFAAGAAVAVFDSGFLTVDPVARDILFDELADPVVAVDGRGRLIDYNAAATALCPGLDASDAVGRPYADVCPSLAAVAPLSAFEDESTRAATFRVDDEHRHYSVQRTRLSSAADVGYALVFREVTDLVAYRRELERQNEQLDQFARTVTHDLRNPLNVAQGYLELAAADVTTVTASADSATVATIRDRFETVARTHGRMRDIVEDLETLARKGKSVEATESMRLGETAAAAWQTVESDGASLTVVRDGCVVGDRSRVLSIFENLFRNCVEHGSTNGRTEADDAVERGAEPSTTIEVETTEDGFLVTDDGPGIPEREREQVFEYGYTTSRRGSGLGLSIVRTMAESHGWTVSVDGTYTDGARFVFADVLATPDDARGDGENGAVSEDGAANEDGGDGRTSTAGD
ncbi:sensor histidine kinase [Halogeometricum limi]|uniref:histidine kinase n=1 Tax=Halogeometricum limi TaxID=555875 RepID=A0A1I6I4C8_9EURY|nr:ATP-binding protein [Halogeometricum limi]SFR61240.1 Signal transduction histidine kinase [Halogeometricum limi]